MGEPRANDEATSIPEPRLIPHVVSEHARHRPQKIWGSLPNHPSDASRGYEDITFARLNYAISRAAIWMQETIEPQRSRPYEALAYLGPPDSRYIVLAIAAIKAGFQVCELLRALPQSLRMNSCVDQRCQMLFLSPRNSDKAQSSVVEQANCQKFLSSSSMEPRIRKLLQDRSELSYMTYYVVPEQNELLKDDYVPEFSYKRTVAQARSEPLVTLHTSSTTGIPKTVSLTQGYGLHEDVVQHVPHFNGLDIITRKPFYGPCRMFVAMPLFHAGGVLLTLLKSIYHDIVSVFQPPSAALNSEVFDAILRHGDCNGCVIPPYLLEDMLAEPSYFDTLASLKFVQFGSGPLSQAAGNLLLTRQKNCPHFIGSSECGLYILLELDDPVRDWQYFRFHPWSGIEMRPFGDGGDTHEMVVVRSNAPKIPGMQPVFELFPELDEWPTRDMYVRHSTRLDHWRYIGRNDDVLVLSNGEKINPVDTESRIANAHPSLTGALVIGQGQFAPGLLLEARDVDMIDESKRAALLEEIWPLIQAANKDAPGHGKLHKSLVLFTSADKPFLRTPKLSVRRQPTIDSYAEEIEEMYNRYVNEVDEATETNAPAAEQLQSQVGVQDFVLQTIRSVTEWDVAPTLENDLFMYGMDSLQVARLTRAIKRALAGSPRQNEVTARMIYSHPTARALSEAIFRLVNETFTNASAADGQVSRGNTIEKLIKDYSLSNLRRNLHNASPSVAKADQTKRLNVVLTGSTGSLGSYVLLALLSNPQVDVVHCLNRSKDARVRQLDTMKARGVDVSKSSDFDRRVRFLHTNSPDEPQLGLSDQDAFHSLQGSGITHVIHNAWPVNFNLSLASFQSHLAGVRALIDFSISAPEVPEIIFISSLSSVTALSSRIKVPEAISKDSSAPAHMGYGESKFVAERILNNATETSCGAFRSSILRVGQIAGPVKNSTGVWPAREWLPSLVISSKTIGALPDSLGRMSSIDWIPVDLLADSIVELLNVDNSSNSQGDRSQSSKVYHVLNPNPTSWSDILPAVMEQISTKHTFPLQGWIELVRQGPDESSTANPNPAKKILRFYEALDVGKQGSSDQQVQETSAADAMSRSGERFEVGKMAQCSKTFREMGPVTKDWMSKWTARWFSS